VQEESRLYDLGLELLVLSVITLDNVTVDGCA